MKIFVGQINPIVGAVENNVQAIIETLESARAEGAELVVFPQLVISGAPMHDLLFHEDVVDACELGLEEIAPATEGLDVILGAPAMSEGALYDSAVIFHDGVEVARQFQAQVAWSLCGRKVAVVVGEQSYDEKLGRVDLIVHLAASPWCAGAREGRCRAICERAEALRTPYLFVNLVGGSDEWIFDGGSLYVGGDGLWQAPCFEESCSMVEPEDIELEQGAVLQEVRQALVMGIRDYYDKQGVEIAHVALSGGIDSSVTAALAVEALGSRRVEGVFMPSKCTSDQSAKAVKRLARQLSILWRTISIDPMVDAFVGALGSCEGLVHENVQSRVRAVLLMALSNRAGSMVLGTSNKSEVTLGYATLYGDMTGALLPLGDVFKSQVYFLAKEMGLPEEIISRAPTAELHVGQADTDDLPEYRMLDPILEAMVLGGMGIGEIAEHAPIDKGEIEGIYQKMWEGEYKRRQAPCILRTSPRAFGSEARYPIVNALRW